MLYIRILETLSYGVWEKKFHHGRKCPFNACILTPKHQVLCRMRCPFKLWGKGFCTSSVLTSRPMRMRLLIGRSAITIPKGWKGNLHCCGVCLHSKTVLYFMFCCVLVPFFYILSERDVSVALSGVADRVGKKPGFFKNTQPTRVLCKKPGFYLKKPGFYWGKCGFFGENVGFTHIYLFHIFIYIFLFILYLFLLNLVIFLCPQFHL